MLLLRILTLPFALTSFAALYIVATKAPAAVEMASIVLWVALPIVLFIAATKHLAGALIQVLK